MLSAVQVVSRWRLQYCRVIAAFCCSIAALSMTFYTSLLTKEIKVVDIQVIYRISSNTWLQAVDLYARARAVSALWCISKTIIPYIVIIFDCCTRPGDLLLSRFGENSTQYTLHDWRGETFRCDSSVIQRNTALQPTIAAMNMSCLSVHLTRLSWTLIGKCMRRNIFCGPDVINIRC